MGWSSECIPRQVWKTSRLESLDLRELIVGYSINQSVVPSASIFGFLQRELYEYNKQAHLEWIAKDLENDVPALLAPFIVTFQDI